mmetsp:Transcript_20479/g.44542  ORF Transcript_20479/g.44542 Transcript_20479/m.44542 type:complete len:80 (-) Transcript_20479:702-941(-)
MERKETPNCGNQYSENDYWNPRAQTSFETSPEAQNSAGWTNPKSLSRNAREKNRQSLEVHEGYTLRDRDPTSYPRVHRS